MLPELELAFRWDTDFAGSGLTQIPTTTLPPPTAVGLRKERREVKQNRVKFKTVGTDLKCDGVLYHHILFFSLVIKHLLFAWHQGNKFLFITH